MKTNSLLAHCAAPLLALSVASCGFPTSIEGDPNVGCAVMKEGTEVHIRCLFVKIRVNKRGTYNSPATPDTEEVETLSEEAETVTPVEACTATRVDGGVKLSCPTSEAVIYDGTNGKDGTDGVDGATGDTGASGKDGADGAAGSDGATGPAGPTGPAGEQGPVGAQGEAGPQGVAGQDGQDGTSCSVSTAGVVSCTDGTSFDLSNLNVECAEVGKGKNKAIQCEVSVP
jgi:hypothetical protein